MNSQEILVQVYNLFILILQHVNLMTSVAYKACRKKYSESIIRRDLSLWQAKYNKNLAEQKYFSLKTLNEPRVCLNIHSFFYI